MAYIYLEELKKILPELLGEWIDKDDENWGWIFQQIEVECHIGTKHKGKKWKKYIEDDVSILKSDICDLNDFHHDLNKKVDELNNKVNKLNDNFNAMEFRVDSMGRDIGAAKSMAQTAKQRTEVDYTKCSKEKSDADVVQEVYNRMVGRGATREELDTFRCDDLTYEAYDRDGEIVYKGKVDCIGTISEAKDKKDCSTCKYECNKDEYRPCSLCDNHDKWEKWEDKDNE